MPSSELQIPLYGKLKNLTTGCDGDEVFYVFDETKISDTKYAYDGSVGYGCTAQEFIDYRRNELGEEYTMEEVDPKMCYGIGVHFVDMKGFKFEYDSETKVVDIQTQCRFGGHPDDFDFIQTLQNNIDLVMATDEEIRERLNTHDTRPEHFDECKKYLIDGFLNRDWTKSFLEIRFPRTKDGCPMSLIINHMFAKHQPIRIRYPLKLNAY